MNFGILQLLTRMLGQQQPQQQSQPSGPQSTVDPSFNGYGYSSPTQGHVYGANSTGPTGSVLGDSNYQGGGNPPPTPTGGDGNQEVNLADQIRRNTIDSYKNRASNLRSGAQNTFDDLLGRLAAFRERSQDQFSNAGQQITNSASEFLGQNARTARELRGEGRARGRALGLGDSSKFNRQNKIDGNLASTQGSVLARRGEEERSNQTLLDQRNDEAQGQENSANTYLQNVNDQASQVENSGYDLADTNYQNSLNEIVNYQRQLAALNPNTAGLQQLTPNFSGVNNTIGDSLAGLPGAGNVSTQNQGANPAGGIDIAELLKRRGIYGNQA